MNRSAHDMGLANAAILGREFRLAREMQSQSLSQDLILVVRDISYGDILSGKVPPHQVLRAQVSEWIMRPARQLANLRNVDARDTDHGIALLSLLMLFFEPHGQYLSGKDSKSISEQTFTLALLRLLSWLHDNDLLTLEPSAINPSDFYKLARCGLLHSAQLKGGFLVDSLCMRNEAIYQHKQFASGYLINPWQLLEGLERYFEDYILAISDNSHSDYASLRKPFELSYQRLVLDVLSSYA